MLRIVCMACRRGNHAGCHGLMEAALVGGVGGAECSCTCRARAKTCEERWEPAPALSESFGVTWERAWRARHLNGHGQGLIRALLYGWKDARALRAITQLETIRPKSERELRRIYYLLNRREGGDGRVKAWLSAWRVARSDHRKSAAALDETTRPGDDTAGQEGGANG